MKPRIVGAVFVATLMVAWMPPDVRAGGRGKVEFTIEMDPQAAANPIWLSYLLGRLAYVTKHPSEYPAAARGRVVPTFAEELAGRRTALQVYRDALGERKIARDPYWDDVARVSSAGFLPEYVWTYFRLPSWKSGTPPAKLAQFAAWQKANLASHKPVTYGGLNYGKPG